MYIANECIIGYGGLKQNLLIFWAGSFLFTLYTWKPEPMWNFNLEGHWTSITSFPHRLFPTVKI